MFDVCIVGAGPAGLSAAIYALRAGKKVVIIEANSYGGQIINTPDIENYPGIDHISGFDFATRLYEQARSHGGEIVFDKVNEIVKENEIFTVKCNINSYKAKTVIIASGVKRRTLDIPGEKELRGMGVSYCATCDGAFFRNRAVCVVGGGNTAVEEAIYLSENCSKVYLIHRRDEFRAEKNRLEYLKSRDNIEIITNAVLSCINGDDVVSSVYYKDITSDSIKKLDVSGVFVAVGQAPDTDFVKNLVEVDNNGYILAGEDCVTNVKGVFVSGDCRKKEVRQLTTATADGSVAALAAVKYLNE